MNYKVEILKQWSNQIRTPNMNKSYQISPSFISLAVKNNEGVEGGLPEKPGSY